MPWSATPQPRRLTDCDKPCLPDSSGDGFGPAEIVVMRAPRWERPARRVLSSIGRTFRWDALSRSGKSPAAARSQLRTETASVCLPCLLAIASHRCGLSSTSARTSTRASTSVGGKSAPSARGDQLRKCPVGRCHRSRPGRHSLHRDHAEGLLPLRWDDNSTRFGQDAKHLGPRDLTCHGHGVVLGRPAGHRLDILPRRPQRGAMASEDDGQRRHPMPSLGTARPSPRPGVPRTQPVARWRFIAAGGGGTKLCLTKLRSAGSPIGANSSC